MKAGPGKSALLLGAMLASAVLASGCDQDGTPGKLAESRGDPVLSEPASASPPPLVLSPVPTAVPALDDADETASELVAAELAIRAESTPPDAMGRLGRIQQAAYRKLVANPPWRAAAFSKAPAALEEVVRSNIIAGEELRALTKPATTLPPWKIVAPPPADELRRYYAEAGDRFGIRWAYLAAIHLVESRMGRIRGTSSAGAQGPMQFIPSTWARYGEGDINNPRDAITAAARYLKAAGAPGDMDRALYAYNHSDRYVRAINIYAGQMLGNERTYLAFYHWQVYVRTVNGDVLLEVGYGA
ncbi:MAG: transglycosylase SLT domain-containing protein [Actinomycetota bacterium]